MPTKSVSWTQQPVLQTDLQSFHLDRLNGGTSYRATVVYEVRDQNGAVQYTRTLTTVLASWPASAASTTAILAAVNTQEGT